MSSNELTVTYIIAYFIVNFITAFEFAFIAGEKGYGKVKYWLCCFFVGIAGWIMVAALPDRGNELKSIQKTLKEIKKDLGE